LFSGLAAAGGGIEAGTLSFIVMRELADGEDPSNSCCVRDERSFDTDRDLEERALLALLLLLEEPPRL
jgi:hypothetical protein